MHKFCDTRSIPYKTHTNLRRIYRQIWSAPALLIRRTPIMTEFGGER
jgi:hypothetical protein